MSTFNLDIIELVKVFQMLRIDLSAQCSRLASTYIAIMFRVKVLSDPSKLPSDWPANKGLGSSGSMYHTDRHYWRHLLAYHITRIVIISTLGAMVHDTSISRKGQIK